MSGSECALLGNREALQSSAYRLLADDFSHPDKLFPYMSSCLTLINPTSHALSVITAFQLTTTAKARYEIEWCSGAVAPACSIMTSLGLGGCMVIAGALNSGWTLLLCNSLFTNCYEPLEAADESPQVIGFFDGVQMATHMAGFGGLDRFLFQCAGESKGRQKAARKREERFGLIAFWSVLSAIDPWLFWQTSLIMAGGKGELIPVVSTTISCVLAIKQSKVMFRWLTLLMKEDALALYPSGSSRTSCKIVAVAFVVHNFMVVFCMLRAVMSAVCEEHSFSIFEGCTNPDTKLITV